MILAPTKSPKKSPPVTPLLPGQFQYNVTQDSQSSATVWRDGKMVRSLFGNKPKKAGKNIEYWNGKDDNGANVTNGVHLIKGANAKLIAQWKYVIGNTSTALSGPTVHRGFERIFGICRVGSYLYYENGYNEGRISHFKVALSDPQVCLAAFAAAIGTDANIESNYICSDGVRIYRAGVDPFSNDLGGDSHDKNVSFGFVSLASDDSEYFPSAGTSYKCGRGRTYSKAVNVINQANSRPSGSAVQTGSSGFYFIARNGLNTLTVMNKITCAVVQTLTISGIKRIAVDSANNLWVQAGTTITRHTVNGDGTLSAPNATINSGIVSVEGMECNGTTLWVADGGSSQQIKRFNSSGVSISTFGAAGGYSNIAAYSNSKFYFNDPAVRFHTSSFAFETDGSYWVVEPGNFSLKKYNSSDVYQTKIQYLPKVWSHTSLPGRAFADYIEFSFSDNPFVWEQAANWGYGVPANQDDNFKRLYKVNTVPGGKTFAFQKKASGEGWEFVELVAGGKLVFTGVFVNDKYAQLYPDGSVRRQNAANNVTNQPQKFYKKSFNYSGPVPVAGAEILLETSPPKTATDPLDWGTRLEPYSAGEQTSDGAIISYCPNSDDYGSKDGWHIGKLKDGVWVYKIAKGTFTNYKGEFPNDGRFEIGNAVRNAGGRMAVAEGDYIFQSYHGEFWKSQDGPGQTNMINIYNKDGIFIGQFGTTTWDSKHLGEAAPGMAGNAFYMSVLKEPTKYAVHTNDESFHGGIGRWEITGLDSVELWETKIDITVPVPAVASESIDLLADLPRGGSSVVSGGRITRNPATDSGNNEITNIWKVSGGLKSYKQQESPDLYIQYGDNTAANPDRFVEINIVETANVSSWKIDGRVNWDRSYPNNDDDGQFFDVLDPANKVIARLRNGIALSGLYPITVYGNNTVLETGTETNMRYVIDHGQDFSISCSAAGVAFQYHNSAVITVPLFDLTADWTKPAKLKAWFTYNGGLVLRRTFGLEKAIYSRTLAVPVIGNKQLMVRGTSKEIKWWQDRWNNTDGKGVYRTVGDTGRTASPGDKDNILQFASKILNNNKFDTWPTPTYYMLNGIKTPIPAGGPIPKWAIIKDVSAFYATMQAAYVWLMEKDINPDNAIKYLNAVKVSLADQLANGADTRQTVVVGGVTKKPWQNGVIKDINPLFEISMITDRMFEAYDIIKGELTEEERANYDAYFYSWAYFVANEGNLDLDTKTVDRWNDNFTVTVDNNINSDYYFYKGGPKVPKIGLHINNRRMQFAKTALKVGLHLKRTNAEGYNDDPESGLHNLNKADFLIKCGKIFMKEFLFFQVAPNGAVGENERTRDAQEKGTHYCGVILTGIADMLDYLDRAGDRSMHTFQTTFGHLATVSDSPKTFRLAFDWYILNVFSRKYPLVYEYPWNTVQDGVSSVDYYAHDVALVAALEKYYKNDDWKRQAMRLVQKIAGVQDGSYPLKIKMNNSGSNPWQSGGTGDTSGRSIQFMDRDMDVTDIRNIDVFNVER